MGVGALRRHRQTTTTQHAVDEPEQNLPGRSATKAELTAYANMRGINLDGAKTRDQIYDRITGHD